MCFAIMSILSACTTVDSQHTEIMHDGEDGSSEHAMDEMHDGSESDSMHEMHDGSEPESMDEMNDGSMHTMHMGCQEDEIDENGNCFVAKENNAQLFGQELDSYVVTTNEEFGFVAKPKNPGSYPGIIMIHEWWGLNDNIKEMAKILAKEGYVVYAVDLYNGEVAQTSERAGELAGSVRSNPEAAIAKMQYATQYLREQGTQNIGSMGWCFGGQQSLQLSLNEQIDATVIYYGQLTSDTNELRKLNGPVLGIFGSEDASIPVQSVEEFARALNSIGIENEVNIYDGVGHAFANPSGSNYAAKETIDAWQRTVLFLNENLK